MSRAVQDDLFALIIAGGRGTRFWPWSRRARPKQCLSVDGGPTLIQQTLARITPLIPVERVLVVTSAEMAGPLAEQLPDLPPENLLVEPVGRNTAPAIGWGASEIARRAKGRNPVVAVLPSDHLITHEARFRAALLACAEAASQTNALVTVGIEPDRPETGFGYLEIGAEVGQWHGHPMRRVRRFVEKPDAETAARYVAGGQHLWNAGMFVFTAEAIRDAFRQHLPHTWAALERLRHSPERLNEIYPTLERTSIDYGIMERAPYVLTAPVDLGWSDLGSWAALAEHVPASPLGRARVDAAIAIGANDNLVIAPGKLVAMVGVHGLAVVDTGDALLICPLEQAQRVREVIDAMEREGLEDYL
ncbi:MAG: NTP transferase domain-containing protein [Alphaproteobacteria bacterium]|nr:NTP transferase domain-containing protein [Alphaproteobacteria bacterium]